MTPGEFEEQVELTIQDGVAAVNKAIDAEILKRIRGPVEGIDYITEPNGDRLPLWKTFPCPVVEK